MIAWGWIAKHKRGDESLFPTCDYLTLGVWFKLTDVRSAIINGQLRPASSWLHAFRINGPECLRRPSFRLERSNRYP